MYGEVKSLETCQDLSLINYSKMKPCNQLNLPLTGDGYWSVFMDNLVPSNSPVLVTMTPFINPGVTIPDTGILQI